MNFLTQEEQRTSPGGDVAPWRQAWVDLAIIAVSCVAVFSVCHRFNVWEHFFHFAAQTRAWREYQFDELMIVALFLPFALAVFTYRRLREVRRLVEVHEATIRSLHAAREQVAESRSILRTHELTDQLTGLANRRCLVECLETLLSPAMVLSGTCAALYINIDQFRRVNEMYGHALGDTLLREIASLLRRELQEKTEYLARVGGNEFVAVLTHLPNVMEAEQIAAGLVDALHEPIELAGLKLLPKASIGVVGLDASHATAADVLRDATMAQDDAKRLGGGQVRVFDPKLRERAMRHARLSKDLPLAIARGELRLVYQPIVSLVNGSLNGVEALLRWEHAELGPIGPAEFIPIAEESDVILAIGEWVFREGCRQMALWVDEHPLRAPAVMSLNMSRKQFKQRDLSKVVGEIVAKSGVPADRIQVEITEDMYEGDMEAAIQTMRELKALGLRLAIDDFGVGSSTFAAVNQFPIDVLKVDRSLVSDTANSADSAAIVHSLAVLVRNLDVKLVAEGVEDQQQMLALQDLGCQYAQGYLFGRPMSAQGIEDFFVQPQAAMEMTASGASAFGNSWENRLAAFQRLELEEVRGTRKAEGRSQKSGVSSQ